MNKYSAQVLCTFWSYWIGDRSKLSLFHALLILPCLSNVHMSLCFHTHALVYDYFGIHVTKVRQHTHIHIYICICIHIYNYIYMCVCICVYVCVSLSLSLSLSVYIYIYVCTERDLCVYNADNIRIGASMLHEWHQCHGPPSSVGRAQGP